MNVILCKPGGVKSCVFGDCTTNSKRSPVPFFTFPKPCMSVRKNEAVADSKHLKACAVCTKCTVWVQKCNRRDGKFDRLEHAKGTHFICALHFVDPTGPTSADPYPLDVHKVAERRKRPETSRQHGEILVTNTSCVKIKAHDSEAFLEEQKPPPQLKAHLTEPACSSSSPTPLPIICDVRTVVEEPDDEISISSSSSTVSAAEAELWSSLHDDNSKSPFRDDDDDEEDEEEEEEEEEEADKEDELFETEEFHDGGVLCGVKDPLEIAENIIQCNGTTTAEHREEDSYFGTIGLRIQDLQAGIGRLKKKVRYLKMLAKAETSTTNDRRSPRNKK